MQVKVVNTFRLANGRVFFGPGPCMLLEAIKATGSIRQACAHTGISYSKAMRMLRCIEGEIGRPAVRTEKGGAAFGGASLTDFGDMLLTLYIQAEQEIQAKAEFIARDKLAFLFEEQEQ